MHVYDLKKVGDLEGISCVFVSTFFRKMYFFYEQQNIHCKDKCASNFSSPDKQTFIRYYSCLS